MLRKIRVDSLPGFPRNAVHPDTEARLTSRFGKGLGEPRPFGRPKDFLFGLFKKISVKKRFIFSIVIIKGN